jgi:competence protein ComEC
VPKNKHIIPVLILLVVIFGLSLFGGGSGSTLTFAVMDVGQGQCIVILTPNGRTIVVDCGSTSGRNGGRNSANIAIGYLKSMGINRIDMAVISHPHDDHINGFPYLLSKIHAKQVLDIGIPVASEDYRKVLRIIKATGTKYRIASKGSLAYLDDGLCLTVLSPNRSINYPDLNENSMVMRLKYGDISFLIASDAGFAAECEMTSENLPLRSKVLVVGHHGSELATSESWLRAVSPGVAAISVGRRNTYGHPSKEVLLLLKRLKVKVYRTDISGAVVFSTDGSSLRVKTYRDR